MIRSSEVSSLNWSKTIKHYFTKSQSGFVLACLFFLVPLCSLPPTRFGFYKQIETGLFVFWSLSALSCLWLYHLKKRNSFLLTYSLKLPIVWGPIFLGILTILISPFHTLPLRDLFGSGQIGDGAATFIASGILACHFSIITRIGFYKKSIFFIALAVGILIGILSIIGSMQSPFISWRYWKWAAFSFPDFLSFIVISLSIIYFRLRKNLKGFLKFNDFLTLGILCLIGYYAGNNSLNYGIIITMLTVFSIWLFPYSWHKILLQIGFFGLSLSLTLLIVFYDDIFRVLPNSFSSFGNLSTLTSRTWLSKVALIDLGYMPLSIAWLKQILIGHGWGTFYNVSTGNMFLIDQISLFSGHSYQPSWELMDRDLMHTHNIITSTFHSLGLIGVSFYLYWQHKLINSLNQPFFFLGTAFLIAYQIQVLLWFQFSMTLPFTILACVLFFNKSLVKKNRFLTIKPPLMLGFSSLLLFCALLQGVITIGYQTLTSHPTSAEKHLHELTSSLSINLESHLGGQRQINLARRYATSLQTELEKSPEELVKQSLKLINYLNSLPKGGNYLSHNLAINIFSELASKPETIAFLDRKSLETWENLVEEHILLMPYRADILLPFFNFYQTLGKESVVLKFANEIYKKNPHDPIAFWFIGSSLLKNPTQFDRGMCALQQSFHQKIERFMPIPSALKTRILVQQCPSNFSDNKERY